MTYRITCHTKITKDYASQADAAREAAELNIRIKRYVDSAIPSMTVEYDIKVEEINGKKS